MMAARFQRERSHVSSGTAIASKSNSGETDNARQYRSLVEAVRLINRSRELVDKEEDLGFAASPAWRLLHNAGNHLLKQANAILRGEGVAQRSTALDGRA